MDSTSEWDATTACNPGNAAAPALPANNRCNTAMKCDLPDPNDPCTNAPDELRPFTVLRTRSNACPIASAIPSVTTYWRTVAVECSTPRSNCITKSSEVTVSGMSNTSRNATSSRSSTTFTLPSFVSTLPTASPSGGRWPPRPQVRPRHPQLIRLTIQHRRDRLRRARPRPGIRLRVPLVQPRLQLHQPRQQRHPHLIRRGLHQPCQGDRLIAVIPPRPPGTRPSGRSPGAHPGGRRTVPSGRPACRAPARSPSNGNPWPVLRRHRDLDLLLGDPHGVAGPRPSPTPRASPNPTANTGCAARKGTASPAMSFEITAGTSASRCPGQQGDRPHRRLIMPHQIRQLRNADTHHVVGVPPPRRVLQTDPGWSPTPRRSCDIPPVGPAALVFRPFQQVDERVRLNQPNRRSTSSR